LSARCGDTNFRDRFVHDGHDNAYRERERHVDGACDSREYSSEVLRLNERSEDDDVGKVVARTRIKDSTARNELEGGIGARTVDEFVREVRLLVHALANDREHQLASVGQRHVDPITELQFVQIVKDGGTVIVVHVAQNHR